MPTGLFVTHPLTGQQVEVWVGNYVLMSYGDGAVMGVPAHDERDFAFAKKYGSANPTGHRRRRHRAFSLDACGRLVRRQAATASASTPACSTAWPTRPPSTKVAELLAAKGLGEKKTTWRLRDWGISRQRYWGTPDPHHPLRRLRRRAGARKGPAGGAARRRGARRLGQPAASAPDFLDVSCPKCGKPARRETDTMDTFVDSSWYFLR